MAATASDIAIVAAQKAAVEGDACAERAAMMEVDGAPDGGLICGVLAHVAALAGRPLGDTPREI